MSASGTHSFARTASFDRVVRAALTHLHDLPYLQTHPLDGLRGKDLQRRLDETCVALGSDLLNLRYREALESTEVAHRLGVSMGEYYREHAQALAAFASLLRGAASTLAQPATVLPPASGRRSTTFLGREDELSSLATALQVSPLVTLVGPGGVGKTRLALELVHRVGGSYDDGVFFCELAPLADPTLVPGAVAAAVGLRDQSGEPLIEAVVRALGGRNTLLVLDNCEHVLPAAATLTALLLARAGPLRVLATSRSPLGIYGEREYSVLPLSESYAALLFIDRARLTRPDFVPGDADATAITAICRRLDCLPLAVELAAARVKLMAPPALLTRVIAMEGSAALSLLSSGPRDLHPRQRGLRATIDWSYRLLDEEQMAVFAQLAIFEGGFSPEAAAAVTGRTEQNLWPVLAALVDASLVQPIEPSDDEPRFTLLQTIRDHAHERLMLSGDHEECGRRHAAYFVARTEHHWSATDGRERLNAPGTLGRDVDNVRAALRWLLDRGLARDALRLTASVSLWDMPGLVREMSEGLRRALSLPGAEAPTAARARALGAVARLSRYGAIWEDVEASLDEALRIAETLRDPQLRAWIHLQMCFHLALSRSDGPAGRRHVEIALAISQEHHDREGQSRALFQLGRFALFRLDYRSASRLFDEAVALKPDDVYLRQTVLSQLGHIAHGEGDLVRAHALFEQSLALARQNGEASQVATLQRNLGLIAIDEGDQQAARGHLRESLRYNLRMGYVNGIAYDLDALAGVAAAEQNAVLALRLVGAAQSLRTRIGLKYGSHDAARVARQTAPARAALSVREADAALEAGRALTMELAVAEALDL